MLCFEHDCKIYHMKSPGQDVENVLRLCLNGSNSASKTVCTLLDLDWDECNYDWKNKKIT